MFQAAMLRAFPVALFFFAFVILGGSSHAAEGFLIEIRGTINPATAQYLNRSISEAARANADFLLVELDTPGGLVSSVRDMAQSIDQSSVPVIVYTSPAGAAATSAGALLMISAHVAAMAPGTNIGAAHPVGAQGEDIKGESQKKAVSDIAAFARSMAELRKRNPKAASEVVTISRSYTAEEALKSTLIDVVALDRVVLLKTIHGKKVKLNAAELSLRTDPPPSLKKIEMSLGEKILHQLAHPNVAAILMSLGLLLIYAEMSSPGLGLAGVAGGLCLIVAFIAFQAVPIKIGGIVLLVLGVGLLFSEVFVGSGGILAFGGTAALMLGLLWGLDADASNLSVSPWILVSLGAVLLLGSFVLAYGASRMKTLTARALKEAGGGDLAGMQGYRGQVVGVDSSGLSGQVTIRGEVWNFRSEQRLQVNDFVCVLRTKGLELIVEKEKV